MMGMANIGGHFQFSKFPHQKFYLTLKWPISENDLDITHISKMRKPTPRNSMAFLNVTDLVSNGSLFDMSFCFQVPKIILYTW